MAFRVKPVGSVRNARRDPANSDHWGQVASTIMIDERFGEHCLDGLADFSHVEVLFVFHQASERDDYRQPRPPRGRTDLPAVGVFADRGPRRPNRIGVTICEIVSAVGRQLTVRGLDAINGTPILDLKPVMLEFLATNVHQPAWVGRLMHDYFRPLTALPSLAQREKEPKATGLATRGLYSDALQAEDRRRCKYASAAHLKARHKWIICTGQPNSVHCLLHQRSLMHRPA